MSFKDKVRGIRENVLIFSLIFSSKKIHHPIKFQFFIMMRRERETIKHISPEKYDIKPMTKKHVSKCTPNLSIIEIRLVSKKCNFHSLIILRKKSEGKM